MTTNALTLALAILIRFEGGPERGEQWRVASAVHNRWMDPGKRWGESMEQVIFRKGQFCTWRFHNRDRLQEEADRLAEQDAASWFVAVQLAVAVQAGQFAPITRATHFHVARMPKPETWKNCVEVDRTKAHVYYYEEAP